MKNKLRNHTKSFKIDPEICWKSSSGTILEHFGRPLGGKMAQEWHEEQKIMENVQFCLPVESSTHAVVFEST